LGAFPPPHVPDLPVTTARPGFCPDHPSGSGFGCLDPPPRRLLLATVGDSGLGVQAAQLDAVVRSAGGGVKVVAVGPRVSTVALVAAALHETGVAALELHDPLGSLKELVEANRVVPATPELFSFGLLERFDVADLAALVAPRPVAVKRPSDRARKEFARLPAWYEALGAEFDPLK
jgi:hypothetical protein